MNAKRDGNYIPTLIASSSADGKSIVPIQVDITNHLEVLDDVTGTDYGNDFLTDQNYVVVAFGVSASDGFTPTAIYADAATGSLLVRST